MGREDEIKVIAYSIWEGEGCPNGRDCEHWYRAEIIWEDQQQRNVGAAAAKPSARRSAKKEPATAPAPRRAARKPAASK